MALGFVEALVVAAVLLTHLWELRGMIILGRSILRIRFDVVDHFRVAKDNEQEEIIAIFGL